MVLKLHGIVFGIVFTMCSISRIAASHTTAPKKAPLERLVPLGSTTAFMCDICMNQKPNVTWYKDGKAESFVENCNSNAAFRNRSFGEEDPMPKIGFLIIYNAAKEDEGIYWCRNDEDLKYGEVLHLKIAFVDEISENRQIVHEPLKPTLGRPLAMHCPVPDAFPTPKIMWTVNSLPVSHISSNFQTHPNGTLIISHFSYHHFGLFECHVSNFAGRSSAYTFIDSRDLIVNIDQSKAGFLTKCPATFRNSLFMFLMGCVVTSSTILIYLGCAVWLLKPGRQRRILRPTFWSRTDPFLAPGFRKAIVPLPDCFANPSSRMLAPPSSAA